GIGPPKNRPFLTFLNRRPHAVSPLGPRAIIIANLLVPEKVRQNEPGMAGTLADTAIDDGFAIGIESRFALIDGLELFRGSEGGIVIGGSLPGKALGPGDMATTQDTLLWILRHVSNFPLELAGRPNIDQRLLFLTLLEGLFEKSPNLVIEALGGHRIFCARIVGDLSRQGTVFRDPLIATPIHNFDVFVPKQAKRPEGIA